MLPFPVGIESASRSGRHKRAAGEGSGRGGTRPGKVGHSFREPDQSVATQSRSCCQVAFRAAWERRCTAWSGHASAAMGSIPYVRRR
jgi:hypothetical protein